MFHKREDQQLAVASTSPNTHCLQISFLNIYKKKPTQTNKLTHAHTNGTSDTHYNPAGILRAEMFN